MRLTLDDDIFVVSVSCKTSPKMISDFLGDSVYHPSPSVFRYGIELKLTSVKKTRICTPLIGILAIFEIIFFTSRRRYVKFL